MQSTAEGHRITGRYDGQEINGVTSDGDMWCPDCQLLKDADGDIIREVSTQ